MTAASRTRPDVERGSIGVLGVGLGVAVGLLVTGGVAVTTAQLARVDILTAADTVSVGAADQLALKQIYARGVLPIRLDARAVRAEVLTRWAQLPLPVHVVSWAVVRVEVDADVVTVGVRARVRPAGAGVALAVLDRPDDVVVTARAQAHVGLDEEPGRSEGGK